MTHDPTQPLRQGEQLAQDRPTTGQPASAGAVDVTPLGPEPVASRRRRPVLLGVAALGVAAVAGGGWALAGALSGGGAQPEDVLPGSAFGLVKVDLDPAAGQKVGAVRFLRAFPDLGKDLREDTDLRRYVFDRAAEGDDTLSRYDFARDIEPWLGDRAGVAFLPPAEGETTPAVVVAIQVDDEDEARSFLGGLKSGSDPVHCVVDEGYALCAQSAELATTAAREGRRAPLAEADGFAEDLDDLGEDGIAMGWVDAARAGELATSLPESTGLVPGSLLGADTKPTGRFASALRFDGAALEMVVQGRGVEEVTTVDAGSPRPQVADLPKDTLAAVAVSGAGERFRDGWTRFLEAGGEGRAELESQVKDFEAESGLTLPDDVAAALGTNLVLAFGGLDDQDAPKVAVRTDAAKAAVDKVLGAAETLGVSEPGTPERVDGSKGIAVGTGSGWAEAVAQGGDLGDVDGFSAALPDVDDTAVVVYADVAAVVEAVRGAMAATEGQAPSGEEWYDHLGRFGMTAGVPADGQVDVRVRLTSR